MTEGREEMIDLRKAEKVFKSYVEKYDIEDDKIELKIKHTYGVVRASEKIAKGLDLEEDDIRLAMLIALLHDIGRFEQVKKFDCFIENEEDIERDHAEFGVQVLFENNLIRSFIKDKQYDDIILKAIKNHNKYKIEDNLTEKELLHAKIIRDADKIDNFRIRKTADYETLFNETEKEIEKEKISDKVYNDFFKHKQIQFKDRNTSLDFWVSYIAWIFDINYDVTKEMLKESNDVEELIDRINYKDAETIERMEEIKKCAFKYLESDK